MNCEANDLAVIANDLGIPRAIRLLGAIVRVVRVAVIHDRFGPIWELDSTVERGGIRFNHVADSMLKPLRNPGDGAIDEVLQRVGLPEAETV